MPKLGRILEQAASFPAQGAITHFCDTDELTEYWDIMLRKRVLASLCGGSPFPRKVMLKLVPPGKAEPLNENGLRAMMANWRVEMRKFPMKWLRVTHGGGDITPLTKQEADRVSEKLAEAGISLGTVGDVLRHNEEVFLLAEVSAQAAIVKALQPNEWDAHTAAHFDPESSAQAVNLSMSLPRLDAVVSRAFHVGREEGKKAVVRGFVAVNLRICRDAAKELIPGDVVNFLLAGAVLIEGVREGRQTDRHSLLGRIPSSAKILVRG